MANFYGQFIGFGAGVSGAAWVFQGESYGYTSGGWPNPPATDVIDRFSFASGSEDAADVGNLTGPRTVGSGHSSELYGYTAGGRGAAWGTLNKNIDKFSFATGTEDATDSGDLTVETASMAGTSSSTHGYVAGGSPSAGVVNSIQKFSTASGGDASAISGVLTIAKSVEGGGVSHTTHGYTVGKGGAPYSNVIERFEFATDGDSADVGDLDIPRVSLAGASSATDGFVAGGADAGTPPGANQIEKWSFASGTQNAASHGNLSRESYGVCGQSSTAYGYASGGYVPNYYTNVIDRYAYDSDSGASDVGNLTVGRGDRPMGHQV